MARKMARKMEFGTIGTTGPTGTTSQNCRLVYVTYNNTQEIKNFSFSSYQLWIKSMLLFSF